MLFAYWMMDRPGMAATRQAKRAEHRAYLAAVEGLWPWTQYDPENAVPGLALRVAG